MLAAIRAFDGAVALLDDRQHLSAWRAALGGLVDDERVAPFLRGYALRRLHDFALLAPEEVSRQLSLALSAAVPAAITADWLEGFLSESAQVLLHDTNLIALIDAWLLSLDEDGFIELLPALRRSISGLDLMERRRLLEIVDSGPGSTTTTASRSLVAASRADLAFAAALPLLYLILGLDDDA